MTKYFVSTSGSDTNNGLTLATAYATLNKACSVLVNGDEIEVAGGIYTNQPTPAINGKNNFKIYGAPGEAPILEFNYAYNSPYQGLDIKNSNDFFVSNLRFEGDVPSIPLVDAQTDQNAAPGTYNRKYDKNGIQITNSYNFTFYGCIVQDFPGCGFSIIDCDNVIIDFCLVRRCTKYSKYGTQGITFLGAINAPGATSGADRLKIRNCTVYDCVNQIEWKTEVGGNGNINEGNGFYSDTTKQNRAKTVNYTGRFLFRENVGVYNGAAGVQALNSCPGKIDRSVFACNRRNVDTTVGEIQVNNLTVEIFENAICTDSDRKYLSAYGTANASTSQFKYNYVRGTTLFDGTSVDSASNTFA